MPKITALPAMTTADGNDPAPIVDDSAGSTKKITLTKMKEWLQSLTAWITHPMVANGFIVQEASTSFTALVTGTGTIPLDDTIPQNTEGDQYMTQAITPKSATNILVIEVTALLYGSPSAFNMTGALFQDTAAGAIAANSFYGPASGSGQTIKLVHKMVAGTTSATTFEFRAGTNVAGTTSFNGAASVRLFGAITKSSMTVREIKAG